MTTSVFSYTKAISLLTSTGKFHINLGLERIKAILEHFGNPQDGIKCIHIAGTNGKGSTCAMLASVLSRAGYKTGLYTSPHLVEYTERIKIDGLEISRNSFTKIIFRITDFAERAKIPATEFEILTAAAFIYFYENSVDFAVIETGLGGRFDATNIIKKPELTIITDIALDHTARLGNSTGQIAYEKAGIIKQGTPVITLADNKGLDIIRKKSLETGNELVLTSREKVNGPEPKGLWYGRNLALVRHAIRILKKQGAHIPENAEKAGIENTRWPARFQYIREENLVIDAAHNPAGAELLRETLDRYFPGPERIFIYSSLNTKDYNSVAKALFRENDRVILTKSASTASVNPETLKKCVEKICKSIYLSKNVQQAVEICREISTQKDLVVFTGSIYTIGEFFNLRTTN